MPASPPRSRRRGLLDPGELNLLKEYAATNGFAVAEAYIDVEVVKQTGGSAFGEMVAYLKAHSSVRVMLVEKIDRHCRSNRRGYSTTLAESRGERPAPVGAANRWWLHECV